ncbi:MAG: sigma-70 family RNA polymerase sigma factor [Synechococcaceae cyanobacterium SM2_3_60]|nr:sigma-70 family RNA polymerase sigma factor [Synechococcaceae cyanobacterium SM2_3_60]
MKGVNLTVVRFPDTDKDLSKLIERRAKLEACRCQLEHNLKSLHVRIDNLDNEIEKVRVTPTKNQVMAAVRKLSPRLQQVASLYFAGYRSLDIAKELRIKPKSACSYISDLRRRVGLPPHCRK